MFESDDKERFLCTVCGTAYDKKTADKNDYICCHMVRQTLKEFNIPVVWQVAGTMKVEAYSLEEAEEKALGDFPLPDVSENISDSWELDKENPDYGYYFDFDDGEFHYPEK